jgi:hypothetical protein
MSSELLQNYWLRADWTKFKADIAKGAKPVISSLFFEDLRQILIAKSFSFPGSYDTENDNAVVKWNQYALPFFRNQADLNYWQDTDVPNKYIALFEIAMFDRSHGMGTKTGNNDQIKTYAGRWLRWKNTREFSRNEYYLFDTVNADPEYVSSQSYLQGARKFYLEDGNIYTAIKNVPAGQAPKKSDGTYNTEYWGLSDYGPPATYYNSSAQRCETKIHYDTWVKDQGYQKEKHVSWQGGWRAKRQIQLMSIPPHLWAGERLDITKDTGIYAGSEWSSTTWLKGSLVRDVDGITVYQALHDVPAGIALSNTDYWQKHDDLAVEWERVNDGWLHNTVSAWQLIPDYGNYLHDYDKNFIGKILDYQIEIDREEGIEIARVENFINCPASFLFPTQTDPQNQNELIIYAYKEKELIKPSGQVGIYWAKDGKCKVPFNSLYITDPSSLGAVFTCDRWDAVLVSDEYAFPQIDAYGILAGWNHWFAGNQYANNGDILANTPLDIGNWTVNPKAGNNGMCGLQNYAEIILSQSHWRRPASSLYKSNWRRFFFSNKPSEPTVGSIYYDPSDGGLYKYTENGYVSYCENECDSWHDYPDVNDPCWGDNESGFEHFLTELGRYDWAYQIGLQFIPAEICRWAAMTTVGKGSVQYSHLYNYPDTDTCLRGWNCYAESEGTFRKTWQYSLGRHTPFIRDGSKGQPPNLHQIYSPTTFQWDIGNGVHTFSTAPRYAEYPERWFSSLTYTTPLLSHFDDRSMSITPFKLQGLTWQSDIIYKKGTIVNDGTVSFYAKQDITDLINSPANNQQFGSLPIYTFTVSGNRENSSTAADNVKAGWMLHLCNDINVDVTDNIKPVYILDVKYNAIDNLTYITVSDTLKDSDGNYYSLACWSKEVCERHDGIGASWEKAEDGTITYKIHYFPQPQVLIDLYDILTLATYKEVAPSLSSQTVCVYASGGLYDSVGEIVGAAQSFKNITPDWLDNPVSRFKQLDEGKYVNQDVGGIAQCKTHIDWPESPEASWYGWFVKAEWNYKLIKPPEHVLIKLSFTDQLDQYNMHFVGSQSTKGLLEISNRITTNSNDIRIRYMVASLSSYGTWYSLEPTQWNYRDGWEGTLSWYGDNDMGLSVDLNQKPIIVLDLEIIPQSFMQPTFYHVDAPRGFVIDNKPPVPNRPAHEYNPYAYLKYVLYYETLTDQQQEAIPYWIWGQSYNPTDKVKICLDGRVHVFEAKVTIQNTDIKPINNPDEWQWIKPYVELRLKAQCCECFDAEQSDPVEYKLLCQESELYETGFSTEREKSILLRTIDVALGEIDENSTTELQVGGNVKIKCSGNFVAGDMIEILGTRYYDNIYDVKSAGEGWIIIDPAGEYYTEEAFTKGCYIINRTTTYTLVDWNGEIFKEYHFAFQAKDNANIVQGAADNFTEVGFYMMTKAPEDYIKYFDEK